MNMPEQICQRCIDDLAIAFKFRSNCESSAAILQSFIESDRIVASKEKAASHAKSISPSSPASGADTADEIADLLVKFEPELKEEDSDDGVALEVEVLVSEEDGGGDVDDDDSVEPILLHLHEINQDAVTGLDIVDPVEYLNDDPIQLLLNDDDDEQRQYCADTDDDHLILGELAETSENDEVDEKVDDETLDNVNELAHYIHNKSSESHNMHDDDDDDTEVIHFQPVQTNKARHVHAQFKRVEKQYRGGGSNKAAKDESALSKPMKECELCGNKYRYQHALDSHMRRHRNEKPFKCE